MNERMNEWSSDLSQPRSLSCQVGESHAVFRASGHRQAMPQHSGPQQRPADPDPAPLPPASPLHSHSGLASRGTAAGWRLGERKGTRQAHGPSSALSGHYPSLAEVRGGGGPQHNLASEGAPGAPRAEPRCTHDALAQRGALAGARPPKGSGALPATREGGGAGHCPLGRLPPKPGGAAAARLRNEAPSPT